MTQPQDGHDVVVIGGGAAGLAGALVLARSRRSVVVVDGGQPRNAPAAGVHGYLTRDGMSPHELVRTGRLEVERYGGRVLDGQAEQVSRLDDGRLLVTLADGHRLTGRRLLVATGLVDELPDVPGVQERWGRDVLHCPYCHGWEVRDQRIAVLSSGPMSVHQALLFRQLSDDVTFLAHSLPPTVEHLAPDEHPFGVGEHLTADPQGRTAAPGVWVAGNVTDLGAQVGAAAAAGAAAGAAINGDLAVEETRTAVDALRAARSSVAAVVSDVQTPSVR